MKVDDCPREKEIRPLLIIPFDVFLENKTKKSIIFVLLLTYPCGHDVIIWMGGGRSGKVFSLNKTFQLDFFFSLLSFLFSKS